MTPGDQPLRIGMLTPLSTGPLTHLLDDPPADLPAGIGGPGPTDLIAALAAAGHHVTAISLSPEAAAPVRARGTHLDLRLLPMREEHRGRDAYGPERKALRAELDGLDVDVVHAQWTYEYALTAHHATVPYVVTVRDWTPQVLRYNFIPYWLVKLGMNAVVLGRRPHLTTPSPSVLRRLGRLGFRNVRHIPNGLQIQDMAVDRPREAPKDPPVLLSVTNEFSGRKNTGALLQAFAIIRRRHPAAELLMIGNEHGPGDEAARWATQRGLHVGVQFLGEQSRSEVVAAMDGADLLVHPAREEPFGIVVIEAMSRGLPVVGGTRAGGVPFILDGGAAGELVDVDDPESIVAGILTLLGNRSRYAECSTVGLQRVTEEFDVSRLAEVYVRAYRDAMAGRWVR